MKELKRRWKGESPDIFKKITKICAWLGGVGTAIIATTALPITLPGSLITLGGYLIATGSVGGAISKITLKNNNEDGENI